jgi:hypothetical protein
LWRRIKTVNVNNKNTTKGGSVGEDIVAIIIFSFALKRVNEQSLWFEEENDFGGSICVTSVERELIKMIV